MSWQGKEFQHAEGLNGYWIYVTAGQTNSLYSSNFNQLHTKIFLLQAKQKIIFMFNFEQQGKTHSTATAVQGAVVGMKQSLCYFKVANCFARSNSPIISFETMPSFQMK